MWPFERKKNVPPPPLLPASPLAITSIIVSESLFQSDDPHDLPYAVVNFVNRLIYEGYYERDELPAEAMWSYHVDYYLAQVNNGGHGQFVGNSGWAGTMVADIRAGLAAIELPEAAAIFSDLERFAFQESERFAQAADGRGFGDIDAVIAALDDRFFAGPTTEIAPANGKWLRTLPNLTVLPNVECDAAIDRLMAANTAASERRKVREQLAADERARDPLVQAFEHLLGLARPRLKYEGWTAGFPRRQDTGEVAHVFGVQTNAGIVHAIFTERQAQLRQGLIGPMLARTSMDELDRAVLAKTGRSLSETLMTG